MEGIANDDDVIVLEVLILLCGEGRVFFFKKNTHTR